MLLDQIESKLNIVNQYKRKKEVPYIYYICEAILSKPKMKIKHDKNYEYIGVSILKGESKNYEYKA